MHYTMRELRHDAMLSARFFKKMNEPVYMNAYLQQTRKWHKTIMQSRQAEIDEHNQIVQSAKEHGIILE